jgi:hypothetical protein
MEHQDKALVATFKHSNESLPPTSYKQINQSKNGESGVNKRGIAQTTSFASGVCSTKIGSS